MKNKKAAAPHKTAAKHAPKPAATTVAPAKPALAKPRARLKTTVRPDARGAGVPLKADIEAFKEGRVSPRVRKMNSAVNKAFRHRSEFKNAEGRYKGNMRTIYDTFCSHDRGITITNVEQSKRVVFQKRKNVVGNANAHAAKLLIDEFVADLLKSKSKSDDEKNMAEFLASVIQESRGKIIQTRRLTEFRRKVFYDPRLKEAQKLLTDAFDVHDSELYPMCQVWSKEQAKWIPY